MNDNLNYTETDEIKKLNHFGCALCPSFHCDAHGRKRCNLALFSDIVFIDTCPKIISKSISSMLGNRNCKIITVDTLKENQYTKEVH